VSSTPKTNPTFRQREPPGLEFRSGFARELSEAMHRRFDQVARDGVPKEFARLIQRLTLASADRER